MELKHAGEITKTERACAHCQFFVPEKLEESATEVYKGHCHRQPPTTGNLPGFPATYAADWCGEFAAQKGTK